MIRPWPLVLLLWMCGISLASAQNLMQDPAAEEILNKLAAKLKAMKSFELTYVRSSQDAGGKTLDSTQGSVLVAGDAYHLKEKEQEMYCDGQVVYTYLPKAKEVMITEREPGSEEIFPSSLLASFQADYKYVHLAEYKDKKKKETLAVVDLEPYDRTKPVMKIRLFVIKETGMLRKWTYFERGSNMRQQFRVARLVEQAPSTAASFRFDKAKHPDVKVVDLR